jgi:hypothetical protein
LNYCNISNISNIILLKKFIRYIFKKYFFDVVDNIIGSETIEMIKIISQIWEFKDIIIIIIIYIFYIFLYKYFFIGHIIIKNEIQI